MERRRRLTRGEVKKRNQKIIILSISLLFILSVGYGAFQTTLNVNVTGKIKIDFECVEGKVWEFEHEDYGQEFRVSCSGQYKVELWGAQGGDADDNLGGLGGYTSGKINLKMNKKYYFYVGSKGEGGTENITYYGGYNGGTNSHGQTGYENKRWYSASGGATDIRMSNGSCSGFTSLKSRIMVASAGGGGGSSFISGHEGCDAISEQSTSDNIIHTGQSVHYSGLYFTDTVMIDGEGYRWTDHKLEDLGLVGMPTHSGIGTMTGNEGDGFAKITLLARKPN